jgi:hypothetical protein
MTNTLSAGGAVNTTPNAAQIAASVLGEIEWASDVLGYCECPGKKSHTSKDGGKDCVLYLDRVPTVSCFHGSCKAAVDAANKRLRAAILNPTGDAEYEPRRLTAEERERMQVAGSRSTKAPCACSWPITATPRRPRTR